MDKRVIFKENSCKGCFLCVQACPKNIIKSSETINLKGYYYALVEDQQTCISCASCAKICPDSIITVFRPIERKTAS